MPTGKAKALIADAQRARERVLEREVKSLQAQLRSAQTVADKLRAHRVGPAKKFASAKPLKATKHLTRVIIPDSHGNHIDPVAAAAFLRDLKLLAPQEIVMLGDHLDCGGTFNAHQRSYTNEIPESYVDDVAAANGFLDAIRRYAPDARIHYLEGNHEAHVERWAARNMHVKADADRLLEVYGPAAELRLKEREITYYKSKEFYQGLAVRGTIKIGKVHFTHGISHSKHADAAHLAAFNGNVVFGHVHRVLETRARTVSSQGHGAWTPGTLAKLQPLYRHTEPTTWLHGYGLEFASVASGRFTHINVPIFADGSTGLTDLVGGLRGP